MLQHVPCSVGKVRQVGVIEGLGDSGSQILLGVLFSVRAGDDKKPCCLTYGARARA
jgi:hypothetical protein